MSKVIGIDLGTTNSCVAVVEGGKPVVITNAEGERTTPSVVAFTKDGERLVGGAAKRQIATNSGRTISSIKRYMGSDYRAHIDGKDLAPQEISAMILAKIRRDAESYLGEPVTEAVITVPAYFDDAQRQATKDAARLANLNVLRLLNEPTAAALAYGLDNGAEGVYLVYDLGGGTFDASLLKLNRGVFEVLATGGNASLGGDDFDHRIFCRLVERLGDEGVHRILSPEEKRRLIDAARAAKEALTDAETTRIRVELDDGLVVDEELTRDEFEKITAHLVRKTLCAVKAVLKDAELEPTEIKGVVLVGGSTRMPCVRRAVRELFGVEPLVDIDPDRVVALGAAMQANKLAGNTAEGDDWLLLDVTPLSLGLETMGGLVEKIIPRNSAIPTAMAQDFTTFKDGQTAMALHVVQGEREVVDACRSLAKFELRGIPPMAAGAARIRVTFQVDADGLLSVSARETTTGVEARVEVKPSYGLTDDEIVRMLRDGNGSAEADMRARELREQQVEARRIMESVASALAEDADLLSADERAEIDRLVEELTRFAATDDTQAIKAASEALTKGTETFAERRMDRSIRAALQGKSLDDDLFADDEEEPAEPAKH